MNECMNWEGGLKAPGGVMRSGDFQSGLRIGQGAGFVQTRPNATPRADSTCVVRLNVWTMHALIEDEHLHI